MLADPRHLLLRQLQAPESGTREEGDVSAARHLSDDELSRMEAELAKHYGEPVRPVSQYCNALTTWARVAAESPDMGSRVAAEHLQLAGLQIGKSNLLWRLIYGGQRLRIEQCPEHKGRWCGYGWSDTPPCACQDGLDITGWLPVFAPPEEEPVEEEFVIREPPPRAGTRNEGEAPHAA